jgi:L-lactate dehydrogenase complex protein LldF
MIVHRAADAAQAVNIILDLLQQAGARTVVKSKSMVSEEVHLNPAIEKAGIRAVETDLGEYIVQLRDEPPAHIITPAVHLTRAQVAQTFVDKLGVDYTEDIPTLTAIARRVLRQTFLDAEVGISGVNFGIAETGGLCLVTNEGNGRMCTTLPRVHIAMMGIERLVPTLDDLALMLNLLPRSATGQKLSVYTTLIHGPRRAGEVDGPLERHVVLLDNGRSRLVGSPLNDALLCIRCGACLNACPVFREIGGHAYRGVSGAATPYPGPIGSVISPGLFGVGEFGALARASSLCGACKDACPVDIDLPKMLLRIRYDGADLTGNGRREGSLPVATPSFPETGRRSHVPSGMRLGLRLFSWMARSPRRFAAAQRLASVFGRLTPWVRLPAFTGWGYRKDFPLPSGKPFRDRFAKAVGSPISVSKAAAVTAVAPSDKPSDPGPPLSAIERFIAELDLLGGQAVRCTEAGLAGDVIEALRSRGIDAVQAWDAAQLPAGLPDALQAAGIRIQKGPDPNLRGGLTGALAGIAETGTLVLPGGPETPLTASLLPETHLAVLRSANILPRLPDALRLAELSQAGAAVLISGPSRTADIEMTLTIGVHGPREVLVFII